MPHLFGSLSMHHAHACFPRPSYQVEEMLLYTAELKRSISEPLSSKKAAVDQV